MPDLNGMIVQNKKPFSLTGRTTYRIRSVAYLGWATLIVIFRRLIGRPIVTTWTLSFEIANTFLRMQNVHSFNLENIKDSREYIDSLVFYSPSLDKVKTENATEAIKGIWFHPPLPVAKKAILYFHGGGYAYFSKSHLGFLAGITQYTNTSIFALDYPLIPENPYPAQLEYALLAYEWLLKDGYTASDLTLMGDSAGGNLCLALLLKLRDMSHAMPSLAVGLCPWTDVGNSGESMNSNESFDWVDKRMAEKWAKWFIGGRSHEEKLISPINADLSGLPPIYIQAGGKEILIDMIKEFYKRGVSQGSDIRLDIWGSMNHDFQAYGESLEEARDALNHIARFLYSRHAAS